MYRGLCPNCSNEIDEHRLRLGLLCSKCLRDEAIVASRDALKAYLISSGAVGKYVTYLSVEEELDAFSKFFTEVTGKDLWSIQRAWARRILSNDSFALIAPTGVGKTTLLLTYSLYRAVNGGRVLYVVPTRELMNQVFRSINSMNRFGVNVVNSDSFKDLELRDSYIAVLTHNFIHRNKDLIGSIRFNVVSVDDFDALLKSSSIVDLLLKCIGVSEEAVLHAKKIVDLKNELAFIKYSSDENLVSKLRDELYQHTLNLVKALNYGDIGQLLIASATGRGRGERVKVLRELLGFEVGSITDYLRNLVEAYDYFSEERLKEILNTLIGGTLIYVSKDMGMKYARKITNMLSDSGFKVAIATSRKALDTLRKGEVDIVVGVASYYGILTRGIDEPLRIYNTIFVGVPKNEFNVETSLLNPRTYVTVLSELSRLGLSVGGLDSLLRRLRSLSPRKLRLLSYSLRGIVEVDGSLSELKDDILNTLPTILKFIKEYVGANSKLLLGDTVIKERNGRLVLQLPDVMTYIQASGRSSRLLNGVMTLGFSLLLVDDVDLMNILSKKLKMYIPGFKLRYLKDLDLDDVKKKQIESRYSTPATASALSCNVRSALLVVESPTKARTIASMFGRPGRRYVGEYVAYETVIPVDGKVYVTSIAPTFGHITDLVVDEGVHGIRLSSEGLVPIYTSIKRCYDCKHQFTEEVSECPRCGSVRLRDSRKVIEVIRKLAQEVDIVFIATDPDDEGEKIAYDVYLMLRSFTSNIYRVRFHEVTRKALYEAMKNPESIDIARVNAQVVRRVDDRFIGFELSGILKRYFSKQWLGGGRVQTPVLNWVVSTYLNYVNNRGYNVIMKLLNNYFITIFVKDREEALKLAEMASRSGVRLIKMSEELRLVNPKPPYTTDELLSDTSRILKLPASAVMRFAQDLFELGLITYHRTDSTHVSGNGIEVAREYVSRKGLDNVFRPRTWGDRGAHECIRPTKPVDANELRDQLISEYHSRITNTHLKLYDLIFRRFIASQLPEAQVRYEVFEVSVGTYRKLIEVPVEVVIPGFLVIQKDFIRTPLSVPDRDTIVLPEEVKIVRGSNTKLPNVGEVIKLMREKGIGRPSTYAKAIDNNIRHGYVILSKNQLYLIPTKLGMSVRDLISKHFPSLVTEELTASMEKLLDAVRANMISREEALTLLLSDLIDIKLRGSYILDNVFNDEQVIIT